VSHPSPLHNKTRPGALGQQLLADLHGCDPALLDDVALVESVLRQAAGLAGATIVQGLFHAFMPQGVSGSLVISESHLAIHTWPEYGVASLDFFTCSPTVDTAAALEHCRQAFRAARVASRQVERGRPDEEHATDL
jgi:S-adenosylmethionine decarboxylase proenzyme